MSNPNSKHYGTVAPLFSLIFSKFFKGNHISSGIVQHSKDVHDVHMLWVWSKVLHSHQNFFWPTLSEFSGSTPVMLIGKFHLLVLKKNYVTICWLAEGPF